jgi:hypothetical protein
LRQIKTTVNLNFNQMKKITLLVGMILLAATMFAQGAAPLSKGEKQLNFGLGFSGRGIPVYGSMDFAIHNDWTVAPVVKLVIDDDFGIGVLGRVDYHWNRLMNIPSNWDVYLGAGVGFISGDNFDLSLGIQIGGRYYWSQKWGINLEFGGGTGYGTSIGVSMKM